MLIVNAKQVQKRAHSNSNRDNTAVVIIMTEQLRVRRKSLYTRETVLNLHHVQVPQLSLRALPGLTQNWKRPVDSCFLTSWPTPLTEGHDSGTPVSSDWPAITTLLSDKCLVVCFCSVAQLCPTLCEWTAAQPGFPVLHRLPELAQTHIH